MAMIEEFKKFIMRGNVVDLAVGVVIGAAFGKIIEAIVAQIFMPIIGAIMKGIDFSSYNIPLNGESKLGVGVVVTAIINFLIVGFCLFLVVKAMNAMQKKKVEAPSEPPASEKFLAEIRDLLKSRS